VQGTRTRSKGGERMRDYELVEAIEKVVATDGEKMTDGECLDQIIELVNEYKSFNFESEGA